MFRIRRLSARRAQYRINVFPRVIIHTNSHNVTCIIISCVSNGRLERISQMVITYNYYVIRPRVNV